MGNPFTALVSSSFVLFLFLFFVFLFCFVFFVFCLFLGGGGGDSSSIFRPRSERLPVQARRRDAAENKLKEFQYP